MGRLCVVNYEYICIKYMFYQRYFLIQNMEDNNILQNDVDSQGDEISQADSSSSQSMTMDVSSNYSGNGSTILEMQDYISSANSSVGEEQEEEDDERRDVQGNIGIDCEVYLFLRQYRKYWKLENYSLFLVVHS